MISEKVLQNGMIFNDFGAGRAWSGLELAEGLDLGKLARLIIFNRVYPGSPRGRGSIIWGGEFVLRYSGGTRPW